MILYTCYRVILTSKLFFFGKDKKVQFSMSLSSTTTSFQLPSRCIVLYGGLARNCLLNKYKKRDFYLFFSSVPSLRLNNGSKLTLWIPWSLKSNLFIRSWFIDDLIFWPCVNMLTLITILDPYLSTGWSDRNLTSKIKNGQLSFQCKCRWQLMIHRENIQINWG